eukprot:Platyproteum_vivax@DN4132_c0_g1_i2.p1
MKSRHLLDLQTICPHVLCVDTNLTNAVWLTAEFLIGIHSCVNFYELFLKGISPVDRLYLIVPGVTTFESFKFAYEFLSLEEDIRSVEFVIHHLVSITMAYFCVHGMSQVYALYFCAVASISTAIMCPTEIFRQNPALKDKYPNLSMTIYVLFAILFYTFRLVVWLLVGYFYYYDLTYVLVYNQIRSFIPWLSFYLFSAVLTILQFYWSYKICRIARKILCPKRVEKKAD